MVPISVFLLKWIFLKKFENLKMSWIHQLEKFVLFIFLHLVLPTVTFYSTMRQFPQQVRFRRWNWCPLPSIPSHKTLSTLVATSNFHDSSESFKCFSNFFSVYLFIMIHDIITRTVIMLVLKSYLIDFRAYLRNFSLICPSKIHWEKRFDWIKENNLFGRLSLI